MIPILPKGEPLSYEDTMRLIAPEPIHCICCGASLENSANWEPVIQVTPCSECEALHDECPHAELVQAHICSECIELREDIFRADNADVLDDDTQAAPVQEEYAYA